MHRRVGAFRYGPGRENVDIVKHGFNQVKCVRSVLLANRHMVCKMSTDIAQHAKAEAFPQPQSFRPHSAWYPFMKGSLTRWPNLDGYRFAGVVLSNQASRRTRAG
jgi:hypothetical protein